MTCCRDSWNVTFKCVHADNKLYRHYDTLCHGINRMWHWIKSKKLSYTINNIKFTTAALALCSKTLKIEIWEQVFQVAVQSKRSLLCTATNMTPSERILNYSRRSSNGDSLPSWLISRSSFNEKKTLGHLNTKQWPKNCNCWKQNSYIRIFVFWMGEGQNHSLYRRRYC